MIKSLYHDGLLNQSVAVFTHVLQDLVSSIVAGCGGGLGGYSQWVDQSLEVNREQCNNHSSLFYVVKQYYQQCEHAYLGMIPSNVC